MVSGCGLYYVCSYSPTDAVLVLSILLDTFGGSFIMQGLTVASQGSVSHQDLAVAIAIQVLWSTVFGAIGSAIASSIWTHTLPVRLTANLSGVLDQNAIDQVYGSIIVARMTEPRDSVRKGKPRSLLMGTLLIWLCSVRRSVGRLAKRSAYCETGYELFLPTLILSFTPLVFHFFMTDYTLDDRHNVVDGETIHVDRRTATTEDGPMA